MKYKLCNLALIAIFPFIETHGSEFIRQGLRGGPSAVSLGVNSALFGIQRQTGILASFGGSGIASRSYKTSRHASTDDILLCNVEQTDTNKRSKDSDSIISGLSGGGGSFATPKPNKSKTATKTPLPRFQGQTANKKNVKDRSFKIRGLPPVSAYNRPLLFWENMICGAISRSVAQTIMHPANTMKTILQSRSQVGSEPMTFLQLAQPQNIKLLTRGAGAQFILSVPHGAVNFAVLELVRRQMSNLVERRVGGSGENKIGPGLDFVSSAISTLCCSVVSTPQMMITDNIMAGTYPNLGRAISGLASENGIKGFYTGWWPGLAGKIPSYGLTWVFFQQLKQFQLTIMQRDPKDVENSIMGCMASATTVCIMIPMDTIKTRLVTQAKYPDLVPYKGIVDAAKRILTEEGVVAFYRGLAPRLVSVVPMIGIQFGVYEFMKKFVLAQNAELSKNYYKKQELFQNPSTFGSLGEIAMEVAADDDQPFPVPRCQEMEVKNDKKK